MNLPLAVLVQPLTPLPVHNPGLFRLDFLSCFTDPASDVAGSASPTKRVVVEKGKLYLVLSCLNFEGCSSYIPSPRIYLTVISG